jgi:1-acyl-sn-glycerol-3-phosphate acyltransferase
MVPTVYGEENLPPMDEVVMYTPNHTSFLDIMVCSGFIPRPFKYLSKSDIAAIPIVGWAMKLAKHIFLQRDNINSVFEVTEATKEMLREGGSMVLFPEGTRSRDGKLGAFKKGAFQMAKEAGVRIVPISVGNLHRYMPQNALMPLAPLRNVYVYVHPPVETKDRKISEIRREVYETVKSGLPPWQVNE